MRESLILSSFRSCPSDVDPRTPSLSLDLWRFFARVSGVNVFLVVVLLDAGVVGSGLMLSISYPCSRMSHSRPCCSRRPARKAARGSGNPLPGVDGGPLDAGVGGRGHIYSRLVAPFSRGSSKLNIRMVVVSHTRVRGWRT